MHPLAYFLALGAVVAYGAFTLGPVARSEYLARGQLSRSTSYVQALSFFMLGGFIGYDIVAGLPPPHLGPTAARIGWILLAVGLAGMFAIMGWLGIRRSFGQQTEGLNQSGPYRFSRNPQVIVCGLAMIAFGLIWSSWHGLGWVAVYALLCHVMVLTEEEHLGRVFGDEYARYRASTPRYLGWPRGEG